jgi:Zinc dependent phospholipase C
LNTPSHFIIHAALAKRVSNPKLIRSAFLWGAVAPDFPLMLLSIGGGFYFRNQGMNSREAAHLMFDRLYFHNPWWISVHHLLHAPFLLLLYALVLYPLRKYRVAYWLLWFVAGCGLHTFVDILTHYDDGPLVFFPLNWTFRVHSISYWDPRHGGAWFGWLELALDLFLLGYLIIPWLAKKFKARKSNI